MKRTFAVLLSIATLSLFSCTQNDPLSPTPSGGSISTGTWTPETTSSVSAAGGQISINDGILKGLQISVPAGAFTSGRTFVVSGAPVTSHTFGPDFTPVSPLLKIENGGGYANEVMRLSVPISVPSGHFAMGFYYDEETGELEPIPTVGMYSDHIVLGLRHFSGKHLSDGVKGGILGTKSSVQIVIGSILLNQLTGIQESAFRPGSDDFEFPNYGTYIAPKGQCAGQSVATMWYYNVKKRREGAGSLNSRFDTEHTDLQWADNPRGIRFASILQKDMNWGANVAWFNTFEQGANGTISLDSLHYFSFCYAIRLTRLPQFTYIENTAAGGGAHAMVIYKAGNNKLWVADPNFPGDGSRVIDLTGGSFQPYQSGLTANGAPQMFNRIRYMAKTSIFTFEGIKTRWTQFENKTIGNADYPPIELKMVNEKGEYVDVPDTLVTSSDSVILVAICPTCNTPGPKGEAAIQLTERNGTVIGSTDPATRQMILRLRKGTFDYGVAMYGIAPGTVEYEYIDFRWLTVNKTTMASFELWTGGYDEGDSHINQHQGFKDPGIFARGKWVGNTFSIDDKQYVTEDGTTYELVTKATVTCNAAKTMITSLSFNAYVNTGGQKAFESGFKGANIPLMTSDADMWVFGVDGVATCSVTSDYIFAWDEPDHYACDDECFVRVRLPKP